MKYLKQFETYISGEAGYIVDFREVQRRLDVLGLHTIWSSSMPYKIEINLNCLKVPYSIVYLLLMDYSNAIEAFPIVELIGRNDTGTLKNILLDTHTSKDIYDSSGFPSSYSVNKEFGKLYNKSETTLTKSIEKLSILIKSIISIGTLSTNFKINDKEEFDLTLQNSIIQFLNEPIIIPEYLLNIIYKNVSTHSNCFQIIKQIKHNQPFIYRELLKLYPNMETGNEMGNLGF